MAYTHTKYEVPMTTGTSVLDLTSTGDKARWSPAMVPHIVRAVAIILNATPGDSGVVKGDLRPTIGSDTSRTDGTVFTINLATSHTFTAGTVRKVIYHVPAAPVTVMPGQEVVVEVTDASASVNGAKISFLVEPAWDQPGNITGMVATT